MVIEGDALPQRLPKPPKGDCVWRSLPALWLDNFAACFNVLVDPRMRAVVLQNSLFFTSGARPHAGGYSDGI